MAVQALQLFHQQACLRHQHGGLRRGTRFPAAAVEQLQVEFRFQVGDRHADGGGHAPQRARGGGKRTVVHRGQEDTQVIEVESHLSILLTAPDFFHLV